MKLITILICNIFLCLFSLKIPAQCTAAFTVYPPQVSYLPTSFTDQSTTPAGETVTYNWNFTAQFGVSGTANIQSPMHTFYGAVGFVHNACLIISSATCADTACSQVSFPNIQQPLPALVQFFKSSRQSNMITFDANMEDGHGFYYPSWVHNSAGLPYEFDWDFGDGTVMNLTTMGNVSHQYTSPGVYTVTLNGRGSNYGYTFDGSFSDTVQINSVVTSIAENNIAGIRIYPNIVENILTMDLSSIQDKIFEFKLTDIQGRVVLKPTQITGGNVEKIDLSNLENQLYIITLQSEGELITKKIVKQH